MIVPVAHVTHLVTAQKNGTIVVTQCCLNSLGVEQSPSVPERGVVIVALDTIQGSRLALISFPNLPNANLIAKTSWRIYAQT